MGVGHAAREWPLTEGACFSAGNSVFEVVAVEGADGGGGGAKAAGLEPTLRLHARTGPKKGSDVNVGREGCTMGRSNDNTLCIPDRELSRRHSHVAYREGQFFVGDMGSTNGTYVQVWVGGCVGAWVVRLMKAPRVTAEPRVFLFGRGLEACCSSPAKHTASRVRHQPAGSSL